MIIGFAIRKANGASGFGLINEASELVARARLAQEADVAPEAIAFISPEEALHQFGNMAMLAYVDE